MLILVEAAAARGATFDETDIYASISTALDLVATLLWGLFFLGFAARVLSLLDKQR